MRRRRGTKTDCFGREKFVVVRYSFGRAKYAKLLFEDIRVCRIGVRCRRSNGANFIQIVTSACTANETACVRLCGARDPRVSSRDGRPPPPRCRGGDGQTFGAATRWKVVARSSSTCMLRACVVGVMIRTRARASPVDMLQMMQKKKINKL